MEKHVATQRQKHGSIARYKDDAEMNMDLQHQFRTDDPMNNMKGYNNNNININDNRPMYRGKPWPNRYGILPGYRWDGIDRSNGFEGKKLLHQSQRKDYKKKKYKWSNEDM